MDLDNLHKASFHSLSLLLLIVCTDFVRAIHDVHDDTSLILNVIKNMSYDDI